MSDSIGSPVVEGPDDIDDVPRSITIDIGAASSSTSTDTTAVTMADLAALEERVSTLLHVHSDEFRAVDARVAQLEQAKLGELMAQAAADCSRAGKMAAETMRAASEMLDFISNSDYIQGEIEDHARNAAMSIRTVVQDTVAEIEKDVRRVAKKR
jgi:hypothetical protein